jgi:hypothetical protein
MCLVEQSAQRGELKRQDNIKMELKGMEREDGYGQTPAEIKNLAVPSQFEGLLVR